MKLHIYLFRHGQTTFNRDQKFTGWLNPKLTSKGINNARTVAKELKNKKFEVAFHTKLIRSKQTINEVLKFHPECKKLIKDNRIIERNYGKLNGTTHDSFIHKIGNKLLKLDVEGDVTLNNLLIGSYGRMLRSADEWLRINDDDLGGDYHTSGTYIDGPGVGMQGSLAVAGSNYGTSGYELYVNGDTYTTGALAAGGNLTVSGSTNLASAPTVGDGGAGFYGWGVGNGTWPPPIGAQNPYTINNHTGLVFSAHSAYGGIRFFNQGYPDITTGPMVMAITGGNVGIGTTGPGAKLDVEGSAAGLTTLEVNGQDTNTGLIARFRRPSDLEADIILGTVSNADAYIASEANLHLATGQSGQNLGTARLSILNSGNVGIGTTGPTEKLEVAVAVKITGSIQFGTSAGPNAYALGIRTGSNYKVEQIKGAYSCTSSANGAFTCDNTISFANAFTATPTISTIDRPTGSLCGAGQSYITSISTTSVTIRHVCADQVSPTTISGDDHIIAIGTDDAADIAEWYGSEDETLEAGDVVTIDPNKDIHVVKSSSPYDERAIGIVPIKPAQVLGTQSEFPFAVPVALVGRVPVKVTLENGPIARGDYLTASFWLR